MGVAEELTAEDVPKRRRTDRDGIDVRLDALEEKARMHDARLGSIERADARIGEMFRAVMGTVDHLATMLTLAGPASVESKAMLAALVRSDAERTARETAIRAESAAQQQRRDDREETLVKWFRWLLTGLGAVASMMAAVIIGSLPSALHVWFYPLFGAVVIAVAAITSYLYIWRKRS